jgi:hypothetical protein
VTSTRLESPIRRRGKWANVEIDEQVLVLPRVDVSQRLLHYPDTLLESVEMAGSQRLGVAKDLHCPLDKAGLKSLFETMSNHAGAG